MTTITRDEYAKRLAAGGTPIPDVKFSDAPAAEDSGHEVVADEPAPAKPTKAKR